MSLSARLFLCVSALLLVSSSVTSVSHQAQQSQTPAPQQIRVRTGEVVVDLSVTSSDGKPVPGLTAADFDVYEDGIKQKIESFRYVSSRTRQESPSGPGVTSATNPVPAPSPENAPALAPPHLISLVFDQVGAERSHAVQAASAAKQYVANVLGKDDLAAVFGIGWGIQVYQSFTKNRESLLKAIGDATAPNTKMLGDVTDEIRQVMALIPANSDDEKIAMALSDLAMPWEQKDEAGAPFQLTLLRTLLIFQSIDRQVRSDRDLAGLLSIVEAQRVVPGRKCLIYFCGGLTLPSAAMARFRAVTGAANRAGVTIYCVDTAGLRGTDPNEDLRGETDAYYKNRTIKTWRGGWNPTPVGGSSPLERLEESQGLNQMENLESLSSETGGYTIRNTNDFVGGMVSIGADIEEYYVLTYVASNLAQDGKFRTITVKPRQSRLNVRARKGYYALADSDRLPLLGFEAELLENLNAKSPPSEFPVLVEGYSFPERGAGRQSAVFVQFPLSRLKIEKRRDNKSYLAQADVMLLVRGTDGSIVRRLSRQYDMVGSQEKLEATRKKDFSFYRTVPLAPGNYVLEAVVRDRQAGKASVKKAEFRVASDKQENACLSSLILGRDSVLTADNDLPADRWDPFRVEGASVLPDLSKVYRKSSDKELVVYFVVSQTASPSRATLEFLKDGVPDLKLNPTQPPPDAAGRIQYVAKVGLDQLKPGKYELRVTVGSGAAAASESTFFRLDP